MILRASGLPEIAECRGRLLGVEPEARTLDSPLDLAPGDAVVLYTDGISEGRVDRPLRPAPSPMRSSASSPTGRRRSRAARSSSSRSTPGGPLRDEVAVLVLRETER